MTLLGYCHFDGSAKTVGCFPSKFKVPMLHDFVHQYLLSWRALDIFGVALATFAVGLAKAWEDGASAKTSPPNAITPKKLNSRRIPAPPLKSYALWKGFPDLNTGGADPHLKQSASYA